MLYDNALLIYAYAEAYQITGKPLFLSVTRETVSYVLRELTGETTVFIVSQRASSIQHADQIIVLEDGEMAGCGTHEELLAD